MIRINLITVGKLKEKYWRDAAAEYSKRLGAFCKLEIVELNESRLSDNPSEKEIAAALENEAKAMKGYTDIKGAYNIAMCIEGKQLSSEKLSKKLSECGLNGFSTVNFIIGSSFGIAPEIKAKADHKPAKLKYKLRYVKLIAFFGFNMQMVTILIHFQQIIIVHR